MEQAAQRPADRAVGEVVEASDGLFLAQCHRLYDAPPLGRAGQERGRRAGLRSRGRGDDPQHRSRAPHDGDGRGRPLRRRGLRAQPSASQAAGHRVPGRGRRPPRRRPPRRYLAPLPPRIHDFVFRCADDETAAFSEALDFLPLLLNAPVARRTEVVAAFLRRPAWPTPIPRRFCCGRARSSRPRSAASSSVSARYSRGLRRERRVRHGPTTAKRCAWA